MRRKMLQFGTFLSIILTAFFLNFGCSKNPLDASQGSSYKILYRSSNRIYLMNQDGSEQHKLTPQNDHEQHAQWSPDGSKVGFSSAASGNLRIYVINSDGTDLKKLTDRISYSLSWSPDGSQIVYNSHQIYVMNADGTNQKEITKNMTYVSPAEWSPDGSKIKFKADSLRHIYVINPDGTGLKRLTDFDTIVLKSRWSTDGSKIALVTWEHDLYVLNGDGSGLKHLGNFFPRGITTINWSLDGSTILFDSDNIYTINADGSDLKKLTYYVNPTAVSNAAWSPDGDLIIFMAYVKELGRGQIFIMNPDIPNSVQVTTPHDSFEPQWSPVRF